MGSQGWAGNLCAGWAGLDGSCAAGGETGQGWACLVSTGLCWCARSTRNGSKESAVVRRPLYDQSKVSLAPQYLVFLDEASG